MKENRLLNVVGILLATIVIVFVVSSICASFDKQTERSKCNVQVDLSNESFYGATEINDSTVHINISDVSCMMLQVVNDTLDISFHNVTFVNYDMNTHELYAMTSDSDDRPVTLEMVLDTVMPYVPSFARIKD